MSVFFYLEVAASVSIAQLDFSMTRREQVPQEWKHMNRLQFLK